MALFLKEHDKTALVWQDRKIHYSELLKFVNHYSTLFNPDAGSRVIIFSENSLEWVFAFYAIWKNNCVPVPVDCMVTVEELLYIVNDCAPEMIFCSKEKEPVLRKTMEKVDRDIQITVLDDIKADNARTAIFPDMKDDDTAVIIYTSGTTGSPKGVMLTFGNLLSNIRSVSEDIEIYHPEDKLLVLLPLHHILPLNGTMIMPLYMGACSVFSPTIASEDIMKTLQDNGVTIVVGVPRLFTAIRQGIKIKINSSPVAKLLFKIAKTVNSLRFSRIVFKQVQKKFGGCVKYMPCGGAAIDDDVVKDFRTLGFEVLPGYGMSETSPMISFTRPGGYRRGSAGQVMNANKVRIVDGEITAKGPNVMKGYYNRPVETADVIRDGWMHTGDTGYVDGDGHLFITGRKKEIIVTSSGKNINPEEIEFKILNMSDSISEIGVFLKDDILQAILVPDFKKIKEQGIVNIEEWMRGDVIDRYNMQVSPYKKLKKIHITKDELPRTRMGKLKRFELASMESRSNVVKKSGKEPDFEEYTIIRDYLYKIIGDTFYPDDHLELDLGVDSLGMVSLLEFLRSTFGVEISEADIVEYPTVIKLSEYIKKAKTKIHVEEVNWNEILNEKVDIALPKSRFTHSIAQKIAGMLLKPYLKIRIKGTENIPDTPCIIAPNHQSFLDGLFVLMLLTTEKLKKSYFYAKAAHVKKKWVRYMADTNNVIVMDIYHDLKYSLQQLAEVLRQGKNIILFPEGTRSKDGKVGKFKKIFAILSCEMNVPVVPVAISGAYDVLPTGSKFPKSVPVSVKVLQSVSPAGHSYESLAEEIENRVKDVVE